VSHRIIEWWETWRGANIEGSVDDPTFALIRYQKTMGSNVLHLMEGSISLHAVPGQDAVTLVELVHHLNSSGAGLDYVMNSINNNFYSAVEEAHGRPLP
jgi:hypothetical protein